MEAKHYKSAIPGASYKAAQTSHKAWAAGNKQSFFNLNNAMGLVKVIAILSIVVIIIMALSPLFQLLANLVGLGEAFANAVMGLAGICLSQGTCDNKQCVNDPTHEEGEPPNVCSDSRPCPTELNGTCQFMMIGFFAMWAIIPIVTLILKYKETKAITNSLKAVGAPVHEFVASMGAKATANYKDLQPNTDKNLNEYYKRAMPNGSADYADGVSLNDSQLTKEEFIKLTTDANSPFKQSDWTQEAAGEIYDVLDGNRATSTDSLQAQLERAAIIQRDNIQWTRPATYTEMQNPRGYNPVRVTQFADATKSGIDFAVANTAGKVYGVVWQLAAKFQDLNPLAWQKNAKAQTEINKERTRTENIHRADVEKLSPEARTIFNELLP